MLVELPPAHPIVIFADRVRSELETFPVIGPELQKYQQPKIFVSPGKAFSNIRPDWAFLYVYKENKIVINTDDFSTLKSLYTLSSQYATTGKIKAYLFEYSINYLVHENLHQISSDEGVVETVSRYYTNLINRRLVKHKNFYRFALNTGVYDDCVKMVRIYSAKMTNSKWTSIAARNWVIRTLIKNHTITQNCV